MTVMHGRGCRMFVGNLDVSRYVREVTIHAPADGVVTTTVEFVCGVSLDVDGTIRLEGSPQVGPLEVAGSSTKLAVRAITFSDVPKKEGF